MDAGLHWLDWVVIALSGVAVIGLGVYCARRQTSTKEYFTASGNMGSLIVGISMFATLLSTITYLSTPGEIIKHGPAIMAGMASFPIIYLIVGYLIIPAIMKYRVTSAYEILEHHLGLGGRLLGASMFILMRIFWMSLIVYISARAMISVMGFGEEAITYIVIITGVIAVLYTAIGGLRAVIITDALQFTLLFGGAILTMVLISFKLGGISGWWPSLWIETWDRPPLFSLDPKQRLSIIGAMILFGLWWISTAGSDQTTIQRYMAVGSARKARRTFLVNSIANILVFGLLALVGLALLGLFRSRPDLLPIGWSLARNADDLFPHYIAYGLPVGVSGLVVGALIAAAMSSLDSGINSVSAVISSDFIERFADKRQQIDEKLRVRRARILVVAVGMLAVAGSSLVGNVPGTFLEMTSKVSNLLTVPLFGLFFLALFVRWSTPFGAIVATCFGIAASVLVAFWDVLTGRPGLGFQWIGITALVVQLPLGCLLSLIPLRGSRKVR